MKKVFLPALLAALVVGCGEPTTAPVAEVETVTAPATDGPGDHSSLVAEVDKTGLAATLADNAVTFVDFTATWCGPCQKLKPTLHEMAKEFEGKVKFVEVDVDKNSDLAEEYEIEAMPTLLVIKNGEVASRIVGVDVPKIRAAIESAL